MSEFDAFWQIGVKTDVSLPKTFYKNIILNLLKKYH